MVPLLNPKPESKQEANCGEARMMKWYRTSESPDRRCGQMTCQSANAMYADRCEGSGCSSCCEKNQVWIYHNPLNPYPITCTWSKNMDWVDTRFCINTGEQIYRRDCADWPEPFCAPQPPGAPNVAQSLRVGHGVDFPQRTNSNATFLRNFLGAASSSTEFAGDAANKHRGSKSVIYRHM